MTRVMKNVRRVTLCLRQVLNLQKLHTKRLDKTQNITPLTSSVTYH